MRSKPARKSIGGAITVSGKSSGVDYFRGMPYLDFERVGDHKVVWELNRHQHLVLLAQAWRLTGRPEFLREIEAQLEGWWGANPYGYGINWASALEVAFRALSWIWVFHIAGDAMSESFRRRLLDSLYVHGRHISGNLSVYFSPNTHLMGEAVALHAIGVLFPEFPRARRWRREGGRYGAGANAGAGAGRWQPFRTFQLLSRLRVGHVDVFRGD